MHKTISNLIITILFAGAASAAFGQTYAVPRELPINSLVRRTFPSYFNRHNRYQSLMTESFFPIGWSKDGKLAYYVEPVDEACGCYFAHLVIQDLRTDKIIWEFKYDQSEEAEQNTGEMRGPDTIRKLWKRISNFSPKSSLRMASSRRVLRCSAKPL